MIVRNHNHNMTKPKNKGGFKQVCSAETNPFIVFFIALLVFEHVSSICKSKMSTVFNSFQSTTHCCYYSLILMSPLWFSSEFTALSPFSNAESCWMPLNRVSEQSSPECNGKRAPRITMSFEFCWFGHIGMAEVHWRINNQIHQI